MQEWRQEGMPIAPHIGRIKFLKPEEMNDGRPKIPGVTVGRSVYYQSFFGSGDVALVVGTGTEFHLHPQAQEIQKSMLQPPGDTVIRNTF